jgi:hypothetical protein
MPRHSAFRPAFIRKEFILRTYPVTARFFRFAISVILPAAALTATSLPSQAADCRAHSRLYQRALELNRAGQHLLGAVHFSQASADPCDSSTGSPALFGYALSMAELGETSEALRTLSSLGTQKNALVLRALLLPDEETPNLPDDDARSRMKLWKMRYSAPDFSAILATQPIFGRASPDELRALNDELTRVDRKSPWIAGGASLLLPGAGQAYVGTYQSAAIAFVLNALFLATTIELARHDLPIAATAAGTVFSVTYVGNILNAADAARRFNENARAPAETRLKARLFPELSPE